MAPSDKPWRVCGERGLSEDYRSKRTAYARAEVLRQRKIPVRIYHWEDRTWQLYEKFPARDGGYR